jgi:hypothetical protein
MESLAVIALLILAIALVTNVANGTWRQWLRAKFVGSS